MSKFHLIQYSTNNLLDEEYLKISKQLCKKYSELHDYDYKFITIDSTENIKMAWSKKLDIIYKELKSLPENEYLVYIDTDIFINLYNKKLEEYIEEDKYQIYIGVDSTNTGNKLVLHLISKIFDKQYNESMSLYSYLTNTKCTFEHCSTYDELFQLIVNPYGFNSGFIIIKNTKLMLELIQDSNNFCKIDWHGKTDKLGNCDQHALSYFLLSEKYFNIFKVLPYYTHSNIVFRPGTKFEYDPNKTFLLHLYGQSKELRNKFANVILNKWKQENII